MSTAHAVPPDPLAPWAEVVPGAPFPMTEAALLRLPDDGWCYELVEGVLVRMPPSGRRAERVGRRVLVPLSLFVDAHDLGEVTGEQGGYRLAPRTDLAPDVGFMRAERLPPLDAPASDGLLVGAPDLAVEVASPTQYRPKMAAKAQRYLAAGTQLVWVIWPKRQEVDVWRPGDRQPSATLTIADTLDGLDVVPGFTLPVAEIFR